MISGESQKLSNQRAIEYFRPIVQGAKKAFETNLASAVQSPAGRIGGSRSMSTLGSPITMFNPATGKAEISYSGVPGLIAGSSTAASYAGGNPVALARSRAVPGLDNYTPDRPRLLGRTLGGGPQISGSNSPAAPAPVPNYGAARNPLPADPYKAQQPFVDPKIQLQSDRLDLDRAKFETAQQRYNDQQAAAAARMEAQQQQSTATRPAPAPSGGGGGGGPEQKTATRPAPSGGGGRGGGGGGGGGKRREPTAAELTRQMDRKNRAKERSDQKARDRGDDRSVHGKKDKWGRDYKDFGAGGFEQWQKDNEERRRKEDNERRAEAEKERRKNNKEPLSTDKPKPNPNPDAGVGADAMWDAYNNAMPGRRMTHAYGNPSARLVRARGDLG